MSAERRRAPTRPGAPLPDSPVAKLEQDVAATIKQVLTLVDEAARTTPDVACHPYAADARRRAVIQALWSLYRRCRQYADLQARLAADTGAQVALTLVQARAETPPDGDA